MFALRRRMLIETILLICIGSVFIYSASGVYAWKTIGDSLYCFNGKIVEPKEPLANRQVEGYFPD